MNLTNSSNPALKNAFQAQGYASTSADVMTMKGTVNKTMLSLLLVVLGATYTWRLVAFGAGNAMIWTMGGAIGGFIVALVTTFKPKLSPYTTPIYAVLEGLFLGGISAFVAGSLTTEPGTAINNTIVIQAVALTIAVFFAMLFAYRSGMIKPSKKFMMGVIAATGGVAIVYLGGFVLSMFGLEMSFLYGNSLLAIGINLVIVVIAALNLILDFKFIEDGVANGSPKYMEWYGAFGLLVTLVWLYIEILKLLSRLASRD